MDVINDSFDELCEWLRVKTKRAEPIPLNLNLIEKKVVDSLVFVEFMMMLEESIDEQIEVNEALLSKVYSLQAIKDNFFND
ncbi:hypothetical protein [Pleionea sediminis]|uniref:hypothetical protein n=1 Tax=Pleionea sediminis TaxID=2569479 RepID=UPI001186E33A|nr:hypothetical protein [Pleionea sediminis]